MTTNTRQWLERKRNELERRLEAIHKDFSLGRSADSGEQAQERENEQVLNELEVEAAKEIQQLDIALKRLESGTWGVCIDCGERIPSQRMEAMPFALTCIDCAQPLANR